MNDPFEIVVSQLVASGLARREAEKAIRKASSLKPVDGAMQLAQAGANYGEAFRLCSISSGSASSGSARGGLPPVISFLAGGLIAFIGLIGGMMYFLGHPVVKPTAWGGFLLFGCFFCFRGLLSWSK